MRSFVLITIFSLATMSVFAACDKPDYQDPRYRSSKTK